MHRHIIVNLQIKKMEIGQIINCIKKKEETIPD